MEPADSDPGYTPNREEPDIVQLARNDLDTQELLRSARTVAHHRGVTVEPTAPHLVGYGRIAQTKWAAWRRKEQLESVCAESLDEQMVRVSSFLDPVFDQGDAAPPPSPQE